MKILILVQMRALRGGVKHFSEGGGGTRVRSGENLG